MGANASDTHYDVAVIGGGIHGVSMACEAASRGLRVILLQGQDIASGASSATSTMLSGDLRKIERFSLGQVRCNLVEQATLFRRAPHLVTARPYLVLENSQVRSALRLRLLLGMYRRLEKTKWNHSADESSAVAAQQALKQPDSALRRYDDCSGLDYRLTVCTALQAQSWGAEIYTRHRVVAAQRHDKHWQLDVQPQRGRTPFSVTATCVINSCGWLANNLLNRILKCPSRCQAKPVNVGQIIVRKTYEGDWGYVLQSQDKRFIYVTPLLNNYLLIGPTLAHGPATKKTATEELLTLYNAHFEEPLNSGDVLYERWARQAVFEDPSKDKVTDQLSEAILDLNNPYGGAPLLNVFGINMLMHRLLAERGLNILQPFTGKPVNPALQQQALPGGDMAEGSAALKADLARAYPNLNEHLITRLALTYGTLAYRILGERQTPEDLGRDFGHHLYENEVRYLQDREWATTAEDILWRRTQLGLKFTAAQAAELQAWLTHNV